MHHMVVSGGADNCLGTVHLLVGALSVDAILKFQVQPVVHSPASLSQCPRPAGQSIAVSDQPQYLILQFLGHPLSQVHPLHLPRLNQYHCHHAPH